MYDEIVDRARRGQPPRQIAAELGRSPNTVRNVIKMARAFGALEPPVTRPHKCPVTLSDDELARFKTAARASGLTLTMFFRAAAEAYARQVVGEEGGDASTDR